MSRSVLYALTAAVLFGASTPLAKLLLGTMSPWMLAGVLYVGSGIGLGLLRLVRDRGWRISGLTPAEWPWLLGSIFFGGIVAPVCLLFGLSAASSSSASLLLNLEAVLTALIAWLVFKENADRRVVLGMVAIVAGGVVLAWPSGEVTLTNALGPLAIAAACLCWAVDNNLTRKVSASDALFIAGAKGLIAGTINMALALMVGAQLPTTARFFAAMLVGLGGYGISLVMFVLALRGLGAARTGAYFATAPFIGAAMSVALLGDTTTPAFWLACLLMSLGVWLHLTERHDHLHTHEPLAHAHSHRHDDHHQHVHDPGWDGQEPHAHPHVHAEITHQHPHFPDIHHRHTH